MPFDNNHFFKASYLSDSDDTLTGKVRLTVGYVFGALLCREITMKTTFVKTAFSEVVPGFSTRGTPTYYLAKFLLKTARK